MAGYYGYSKSNNAVLAESELKFPKTRFKKLVGVDPTLYLDSCEWHHTSKYYNNTDYFSVFDLLIKIFKDENFDVFEKIRKKKIYPFVCKRMEDLKYEINNNDEEPETIKLISEKFFPIIEEDLERILREENKKAKLEKRREKKRIKAREEAKIALEKALKQKESKDSKKEAIQKYFEYKEAYPYSNRSSKRWRRMRENWWDEQKKHEDIVNTFLHKIYKEIKKTNLSLKGLEFSYRMEEPCFKSLKEEAIQLLLKEGADVNIPNGDGDTSLHWTIHHNKIELAQLLINAGADVNAKNKAGETPIYYTPWYNRVELAKLLLEAGAKPYIRNEGRELHWAAEKNHKEIAELLIKAGVDKDAKNKALHHAARNNSVEVVKVLIEAGVDKDAKNKALHCAARNNSVEVVEYLKKQTN